MSYLEVPMTVLDRERVSGFDDPTSVAPFAGAGARSMTMRRSMIALGVIVLALALTALFVRGLVGSGTPANAAATDDSGTVQTKWGPLTASDRDLVTRVRWAGLWEAPAGDMAQQRASSPVVKDIGKKIMNEHMQLDEAVRTAAGQLGMGLPNDPNPDQKFWLSELSQLNGTAFDQKFVDRLRVAHGKVYKIAAGIRSTTSNSLIRSLAVTGMEFVQRHMTYLESTGLANMTQIAAAVDKDAAAPVKKVDASGWPTRYADKIILVALLIAGAVNFLIFRRSRRKWADLA
jgi:putative membrane protein